ncbi:hypothetical protein HDU67_000152, partial [Dinochytrium kinnereticum]
MAPVGTITPSSASPAAAAAAYDARTAIAYTTYAASDDILIVSDIAGKATHAIPSDLLQSWSDYRERNDHQLVPVVSSVRNPRANLVRDILIAQKRASNPASVSILLGADHLVNAVPALYHLAAGVKSSSSATLHVILQGWAAASQALAFVSHVSPLAVLLAPEGSVQEIHDLSLATHRLSSPGLPVALFSSALSDSFSKINVRSVKKGAFVEFPGDAIKTIESALGSIAPSSTEDSSSPIVYKPFEYTGLSSATHIIVVLGTAPRTIEEALHATSAANKYIGIVRVRVLRPWSASHLLAVIPTSATHLAIVEATNSSAVSSTTGLGFGQLFLDVAGSFHSGLWTGPELPSLREARVILAVGQTVGVETAKAILDVIAASFVSTETGAAPSFVVDVRSLYAPDLVTAKVGSPFTGTAPESDLETPYLTLLNQIFRDRLDLANV